MTCAPVRVLVVDATRSSPAGYRRSGVSACLKAGGYDVADWCSPGSGLTPRGVRGLAALARELRAVEGIVVVAGEAAPRSERVLTRIARRWGMPVTWIAASKVGSPPTGVTRVIDIGAASPAVSGSHGGPGDRSPGVPASLAPAHGRELLDALIDAGLRPSDPPRHGVAPLSLREIRQIEVIHRAAFPASVVTRLGPRVVRRYYTWQFIGPHPAPVARGAWRDGRLVGFVFGGRRHQAVTGFVRTSWGTIAVGALAHPLALRHLALPRVSGLLRLIRTQGRSAPHGAAGPGISAGQGDVPGKNDLFGILSIAVDPAHRGDGSAQDLLGAALLAAKDLGSSAMNLTVDVDNGRAIAFYEKNGWQRDPSDSSWSGRMMLPLEAV